MPITRCCASYVTYPSLSFIAPLALSPALALLAIIALMRRLLRLNRTRAERTRLTSRPRAAATSMQLPSPGLIAILDGLALAYADAQGCSRELALQSLAAPCISRKPPDTRGSGLCIRRRHDYDGLRQAATLQPR